MPVREGPPQPPPPRKNERLARVEMAGGWGIWTGIAAIAAVVFLSLLFVMPGVEESNMTPTTAVEKTTPAPNSTPSQK